ncbi:MAG: hypothetical protein ABI665_09750 [Vicinamibacterales bacterium]
MAKKMKGPTPVEAIKHKDTRKNIPTEELRDFIADDEAKPKTMLYPRDPSLDPQLVWKGKDEQDQADLAVPVVPIYIQDKVHPQAIIEHLRDTGLRCLTVYVGAIRAIWSLIQLVGLARPRLLRSNGDDGGSYATRAASR